MCNKQSIIQACIALHWATGQRGSGQCLSGSNYARPWSHNCLCSHASCAWCRHMTKPTLLNTQSCIIVFLAHCLTCVQCLLRCRSHVLPPPHLAPITLVRPFKPLQYMLTSRSCLVQATTYPVHQPLTPALSPLWPPANCWSC